jgi:hypothetical protein
VVINEIMSRSQPRSVDKIELFNTANRPTDIGGWYLTDSAMDLFKFRIPAGTILRPSEYLVFDETQLGFGFKGSERDDAWLIAVNGTGRPDRFADHIEFPASLTDRSRGRWPNGSGPFVLMQSQSFGGDNRDPYGDFDNDRTIGERDILAMCAQTVSANPDLSYDLTADLRVDDDDLGFLVRIVMQTEFGDADLDRRFDSRDLILVLQAGEYEDGIPSNSTWSDGDWNCDGEFTSRDVVLAFQGDRYLQAAVAVTDAADASGFGSGLVLPDRSMNGRQSMVRSNGSPGSARESVSSVSSAGQTATGRKVATSLAAMRLIDHGNLERLPLRSDMVDIAVMSDDWNHDWDDGSRDDL